MNLNLNKKIFLNIILSNYNFVKGPLKNTIYVYAKSLLKTILTNNLYIK
jgi:hypothetical protein